MAQPQLVLHVLTRPVMRPALFRIIDDDLAFERVLGESPATRTSDAVRATYSLALHLWVWLPPVSAPNDGIIRMMIAFRRGSATNAYGESHLSALPTAISPVSGRLRGRGSVRRHLREVRSNVTRRTHQRI